MWVTHSLLVFAVFQVIEVNASGDLNTEIDLMGGQLDQIEADITMGFTKLEEIGRQMETLLQYFNKQGPTNTSSGAQTGILVAGGLGTWTSAEVFIPANGKTCLYPDLPHEATSFTLDLVGDLPTLCGSIDYGRPHKSCVQLTPPSRLGKWAPYATLEVYRRTHSSWVSSSGLVLIGGNSGGTTTELVPAGGKNFTLETLTRNACAITTQDSVILTGGITIDYEKSYDGDLVVTSEVARYNLQGFVENLPHMSRKRFDHGCGSYTSGGTLVLIVAGGLPDNSYQNPATPLSTAEKLVTGSTAWTATKPLPRILTEMASVSMNNKVYFLGGQMMTHREQRAEILAFDGEDWKEVGKMKKERSWHSASKIVSIDGEELCL